MLQDNYTEESEKNKHIHLLNSTEKEQKTANQTKPPLKSPPHIERTPDDLPNHAELLKQVQFSPDQVIIHERMQQDQSYKQYRDLINQEWHHVGIGKSSGLLHRTVNSLGWVEWETKTIDGWHGLLQHYPRIRIGDDKSKPLTKLWIADPEKNFWNRGIKYDPSNNDNGQFNMFTGWQYEPLPFCMEYIQPFLDHIHIVWCKGNKEHSEHVINWLASIFQKPWLNRKVITTLVLQSIEGTGKGIIVDPIGEILGSNYSYLKGIDRYDNNFNAQMQHKQLNFLDEIFLGEKRQINKLRGDITSDVDTLELKGVDAISTRNLSQYILAGNEENMLRVTYGDRRHFILKPSPEMKGNNDHFDPLVARKNSHVFKAMLLDYFMRRDISGFRGNSFPISKDKYLEEIDYLDPDEEFLLRWAIRSWQNNIPEEVVSVSNASNTFEVWCSRNNKTGQWGKVDIMIGKLFSSFVRSKSRKQVGESKQTYWLMHQDKKIFVQALKDKFRWNEEFLLEVLNGKHHITGLTSPLDC